ncbi:3'-5' exonuclease [soil metagenome]|jgi:DNA polymerase-3 subunit epsilon
MRRALRGTSAADPALPWRDAEYCVLDFETTGLDLRRDDIISFGLVQVRAGRMSMATSEYGLVTPRRGSSVPAFTTHALGAADLADAMDITSCAEILGRNLTGRVLVAHASWIEKALIDRALGSRGEHFGGPVVDTAALARASGLAPDRAAAEPSLEVLAGKLGLPVHTPHHALGDALTTGQVFLALASRLESAGKVRCLGDLVKLTRTYKLDSQRPSPF